MQTVIGLCEERRFAHESVEALEEAGFAPTSMGVHLHQRDLWRSLDCTPRAIITRDLALSAALGGAIFGYFGVMVATGEALLGQSGSIAAAALIGFILAGGLCGALIGLFLGFGDMEQRARFYLRGLRAGGALVVVRTADEHAARAMAVMQQAGLQGVKLCRHRPEEHLPHPNPATDAVALWVRRLARSLGLLLGLVVVLFLFAGGPVGGGALDLLRLSTVESLLLAALSTTLLGLAIAWRWEAIGGFVILASVLLFVAVEALAGNFWRLNLLAPGFVITGALFLWTWWHTLGEGHAHRRLPIG